MRFSLGVFSLDALGGERDDANLRRSLTQAMRYYLADRDSGRGGWQYPDFRRDGPGGEATEIEIAIDDAVWKAFSAEAKRQGVSADKLLEHAALYFAADRDAGRITQRILEEIERESA